MTISQNMLDLFVAIGIILLGASLAGSMLLMALLTIGYVVRAAGKAVDECSDFDNWSGRAIDRLAAQGGRMFPDAIDRPLDDRAAGPSSRPAASAPADPATSPIPSDTPCHLLGGPDAGAVVVVCWPVAGHRGRRYFVERDGGLRWGVEARGNLRVVGVERAGWTEAKG